jgi:two-component system sensor histidine kinase EvgS
VKKYIIFTFYFLIFFTNIYAATVSDTFGSKKIKLTVQEKNWIQNHPLIKVHNEKSWAPFNYNLNNTPKGFSIDYMNLLAKKIGLHVKYISGFTWNEFLSQIKDKKIDVMLNILKTKKRMKYILFTDNYYISNPIALILRKDENINDIKDLFGKTVAITKGFYYGKLLKKYFPKIKLLTVDNDEKSVLSVSTSKADAAFGKLSVANYYMIKNTLNNIKLVEDRWLTNEKVNTKDYIGVRKDWPILQKLLSKAMSALSQTELNRLKKKWSIIDSKNDKFKESLNKKEKDWIKKHSVVKFVIDPSKEPFEYLDKNSGKFKGIVKDYIDILDERTGIKFKFIKSKSWEDSIKKVKSKEADMYSSINKTASRLKTMNFSSAYLNYPFVIVTKNDTGFLTSLESINDKRIAVIKGKVVTKYLEKKYKNIKKIYVKNLEEALRYVSEEKAYALVASLPIVSYQINKYGYNDLKISGRLDISLPLFMAMRKDLGESGIEIINKALSTITKKKKEEIYNKHINIIFEQKINYKLIWGILSIAFLIFIVSFLWIKKLSSLNRKINEQKKIFETIYEKAFDAILLMENGKFIDCNEFAIKVFGLNDKKDILMKNPVAFSPKFQPDSSLSSEKAKIMIEKAMKQGYHHFEWLHKRANSKNFWADVALTKIKIDKKDIIHVRLIDIQGEKEAKKEAVLAKEEAQNASRYKSKFLANMSHEIRTPMNAILGFADLLTEDISDEKLKSYAKTIKSAGETLLTLINDILDLSKIEAGKLTLSYNPVNLETSLNAVIEIFILKAQEKGLKLILNIDEDIPKVIWMDDIRLRQILLNLMGNAIKFTNHGFIKLEVKVLHIYKSNETIDLGIFIEDTGVGIKEDELKNIFKSFTQQSGQSLKKYGGTGLGLSISKELTKMMNGKIEVSSIAGEGSVFELRFFGIKIANNGHINHKYEDEIILSKLTKEKIYIPSIKTKINIKKIQKILNQDILPLLDIAKKTNDMYKINEFVHRVKILAKEYDIALLDEYVGQINSAIDIFDVKKIKIYLQKFIEIEKRLL